MRSNSAMRVQTFVSQIEAFRKEWLSPDPTLVVSTSGSTGVPKQIRVEKARMRASARRTCLALGVKSGAMSLLCLPVQYIAGRMVCVRAWECGLRLVAVEPSLHPLAGLDFVPDFVAMTPAQVFETLRVPNEAAILKRVGVLIIGGGAVGSDLANMLRDVAGAWCTYGMTETLSHIALKRVREELFTPLPEVSLSLDGRGCLVVTDSVTGADNLLTNDLADLRSDGKFRILGRADNVICSGGLKWQIEDIESRLSNLPVPFQITSVPDKRLGRAIVLLYQVAPNADSELLRQQIQTECRNVLPRHAAPRHLIPVGELPLTPTGKPDRSAARRLAETIIDTSNTSAHVRQSLL